MQKLFGGCLGAFLGVVAIACGGGDKGEGGAGGTPNDDGGALEAGVCLAPTAAGECGTCNKEHCCAEQLACLTDTTCAYAGAIFLQCAAADGGPSCYDPFLQNGGPKSQQAVDCARSYCKTPCLL
jgi:hypothetical protein